MASTQELETKVLQLERMVKFVLTAFQVHDVNNPFSKPQTLLDEYYRVQAAGQQPNLILPPGVRDAEIVETPPVQAANEILPVQEQ